MSWKKGCLLYTSELLRAVIMGYHLIVLDEVGALVSDDELKKLHGIIRHYVEKGFSFLYICSHLEAVSYTLLDVYKRQENKSIKETEEGSKNE